MKFIYTFILVVFAHLSFGQTFTDVVNYITALPDSASKASAVDSFMMEFGNSGFPYVDGDTANFIYRGNSTGSVALAGDFNGWDFSTLPLTRITQTDLWYASLIFESNARMDYKFVLNGGNWILDPLNPNTVSGGFGPNSELAMPGYVQPWEIEEYAHTSKGTMETFNISSTNTNKTYQVQVYLPYGYDPDGNAAYPTAYFQDGQEYVSLAGAKNIFDNLIDSGLISPTIGVFVRPTDRNSEYAGSLRNSYRLFFVNELVPEMDANYLTFPDPSRRAVIGASFGGNISGLISYNHADVFGNCGLHSGAFWPNNNEAYDLVVNGSVKNLKYASIWGSYEGGLTSNMQSFKDEISADGYDLWWNELPEGHSWGLWRATTDDMLKFFFPPGLVSVEALSSRSSQQVYVYPNPVSGLTSITIDQPIPEGNDVQLFDIRGKLIRTISMVGSAIELDLSSVAPGVYFLKLEGIPGQAKKIVVK